MSRSQAVSKQIFNQILEDYVHPYALELGFTRGKKAGWYVRWEGDCLWDLTCAFRMEKNRDEGWVFVSMCVGFRSLDEFLQRYPELGGINPNEPCAMGTDTSHLRGGPPYQSIQWRILPGSDADDIGPEVIHEIKNYALPYFDRFGSLDKCVAAWEAGIFYNAGVPHGDCHLAAAYWLRGDRERALNHIRKRL